MREMGKVELVAVCDVFPEKAQAAAEQFGAKAWYGDVDRMLAEADFDLLVNNTTIPQHFPVTLAGLRAGRHVYTQKPMTHTVEEATQLIEEARERHLTLAVAPEHPVRPHIQAMRQQIVDGAIGKVTFARVQSSHDGPEKHDVPRDSTWFFKPGSSPILDMGVHGLSQITAIIGPVRRLSCLSGRSQDVRITTKGAFAGKRIDVEIDDNSLLQLDFGDARFAFLDATYCVPASLGPRLEIHGTEGTLAVTGTPQAPELQLYRTRMGEWQKVEVPAAPPIRDLGVLHMVDTLREGSELILTGERGRHLVEVMDKAPIAAAEGRTLEMETSF
jgi:predicted dehydrogenase